MSLYQTPSICFFRPVKNGMLDFSYSSWIEVEANCCAVALKQFAAEPEDLGTQVAVASLLNAATTVVRWIGGREYDNALNAAEEEFKQSGKVEGWLCLVDARAVWISSYDLHYLNKL